MADFTGTSGDDHITGTDSADFIDVSQGGNDTVDAAGGDDVIFIGATLAKGDHIDGGDGYDVLKLDGDYSHVVKLNKLIGSIEEIDLAAGHDYHLLVSNNNVAGAAMTLDASALGGADSATLDAHNVKSGSITLIGGAGNDTLIGSDRGHALNTLDGGGGNDTIYSDGTNFSASNTGGPHTIDGGAGNDTIYCAEGDTARGGDGNDVIRFDAYFFGSNNLLNVVDAGAGDDRVTFFNASFEMNGIQGGDGTDTLIFVNHIQLTMPVFSAESTGFEVLESGGVLSGDDTSNDFDFSGFTMLGGGGVVVAGQGGDDIVIGSSGDDYIQGVDGNDVLEGRDGQDRLAGYTGDDRIVGGLGRDQLAGGDGADRFIYESTQDSSPDAKSSDVIADFGHSQGDLIDLSAIDADTTQDGNQAFHLGGSEFTGTPGELIQFVDARGHLILQGDVNGDGLPDLEIHFKHVQSLVADDFVF